MYCWLSDTGEEIPLKKDDDDDDDDADNDQHQQKQKNHQKSHSSHQSSTQLFIDSEKRSNLQRPHSASACDINSSINNNNNNNNDIRQQARSLNNRNVYANKLTNAKSFLRMEQELSAMSATSQYDIDYSTEMDIEK